MNAISSGSFFRISACLCINSLWSCDGWCPQLAALEQCTRHPQVFWLTKDMFLLSHRASVHICTTLHINRLCHRVLAAHRDVYVVYIVYNYFHVPPTLFSSLHNGTSNVILRVLGINNNIPHPERGNRQWGRLSPLWLRHCEWLRPRFPSTRSLAIERLNLLSIAAQCIPTVFLSD